jgi:hypothetical protein
LTPHLPTQQAIPKSEEKESHEKLERKSLCPLDILQAISTIRISDPAPPTTDLERERHRGVRCIRLVGRAIHLMTVGLKIVNACTCSTRVPPRTRRST